MVGSEYGGQPGIIQPDVGDATLDPEAAAAGLGHPSTEDRAADRRGVRDAAMVVRRAGLLEARGVPGATSTDAEGVVTVEPYTEEIARDDYVLGRNDSVT